MIFILILIITTLSIAGSAAFFSIYGLAQIFTGSFWPIIIMATSLEVGKLVAASYVYRFWYDIGFLMKSYLISAIVILMVITSAGIFGFLSSAHQKDILPLELMQQKIILLQEEKSEVAILKEERLDRRKQIDLDIAALPSNFVTGRQKLMKSYGPELEQIRADIKQYTTDMREATLQIQELKSGTLQKQTEIGPIIFIAESFGLEVGNATKWLILMIIVVFDPLAVVLTIAVNVALKTRRTEKVKPTDEVASPIDVLNKPNPAGFDVDQIQHILNEFQTRATKLTPAELAQQSMLQEMIMRKHTTETLRRKSSD